jgi:tRNA modification GTPase
MADETIFALATGYGRAGIAVIRVSGRQAPWALERLSGRAPSHPRLVRRVDLRGAGGEILDRALAVWFPGPASFTGEDVVELHVHGGRSVVAGILEELGRLEGLRGAEPGEFTRRAFIHGKLDLTAAEGLADLVAAETAAQRRVALAQAGGSLERLYEGWRLRLVAAAAKLEAEIDFSDQDLDEGAFESATEDVADLAREMRDHLAASRRGAGIRDGFRVVILGAPNVGKSTLLNALAGREAAIVSPQPGTTRDVIEVALDLGGYPVILADTAGLRVAEDAIEEEGIRRTRRQADEATVKLALFDGQRWPEQDPQTSALIDAGSLVVVNKADLMTGGRGNNGALFVSAKSGAGLDGLVREIVRRLIQDPEAGEAPVATRARHRDAVAACLESLEMVARSEAVEVNAELVRRAMVVLGRVTGRVDVEDVLDVVFRDFCIGK